jgi:hypothetical protein
MYMNRILILILILSGLITSGQNVQYAWSNTFGSQSNYTEANFIAVDLHGNVFTVGAFSGTSDFDHGPGTSTLSNNTLAHYIRKTDSTGAFLWVKQFGGNTTQNIRSIATDSKGNLFLSGFANAGIDLDPGQGNFVLNTPNNNFIIKLSADGDLMWSRIDSTKFSATYQSICIDKNDNLYASGYYMAGNDFDKGTATFTLVDPPPSEKYVFVTKLDPSGGHIWSEALCNQPPAFFISSLCADKNGNAFLSGSFGGTLSVDPGFANQQMTSAGNYDAFLIRVDSLGAFDWATYFGGGGEDEGSSVICDPQGNVILVGGFTGSVDFDPGPNTHALNAPSSGFVVKLSASGDYQWANTCTSWISSDQTDRKVTSDGLGNIFVSGYVLGSWSFPSPSTITLASHGDRDVAVAKYTQNGSIAWAGLIGGEFIDQPYAISMGPGGMLYVCGAFSSLYADLDPDSTIVSASTGTAINSAFIVAFAQPCASGLYFYVPDVVDFFCAGSSLEFTAVGGLGTIEWFWDDSFSGTGNTYVTPTLALGNHSVMARERTDYCSGGTGFSDVIPVGICAGLKKNSVENAISVYPNPCTGVVKLRCAAQAREVQVYDAAGANIPLSICSGDDISVDLSLQARGIYLIVVLTDEGLVFSRRIIKE